MKHWSSHALRDFTKGAALPYRSGTGILVTAAHPRPGVTWGSPNGRDNRHLIDSIAIAWEPFGGVIGGRWLCGATSIGARLIHPDQFMSRFGSAGGSDSTPDEWVCSSCRIVRDGDGGACVYRVYDKTGTRLLYIGSTKNWPKRRASHRLNTWWWQLAKTVDVQTFATIAEARVAEAEAIRRERPQMNVAHNRGEASA